MILLSLTSYLTNFVCFPSQKFLVTKKHPPLGGASASGVETPRGSRGVFRQDVLSGMDLICSLFHRDVDRRRDDRGPFPCTLASRHIIVASSHPWDPPKPLVALLVAPPV